MLDYIWLSTRVENGIKTYRHLFLYYLILTFLNEVPSLTRGTLGKDLLGFITSDPARRLYKLLITISKSDVVLTGKNRLRGTLIPEKNNKITLFTP